MDRPHRLSYLPLGTLVLVPASLCGPPPESYTVRPAANLVGCVRYCGPAPDGSGNVVGIELDEPLGTTDGCFDTTRLFVTSTRPHHTSVRNENQLATADGSDGSSNFDTVVTRSREPSLSGRGAGAPKHFYGVFARPSQVVPIAAAPADSSLPHDESLELPNASAVALPIADETVAVYRRDPERAPLRLGRPAHWERREPKAALKVGVRVVTRGKRGVLRFVGRTAFARGVWYGVELDEPHGRNDGSVKGKYYFLCPRKHGLFVKASSIITEFAHTKLAKVHNLLCTLLTELGQTPEERGVERVLSPTLVTNATLTDYERLLRSVAREWRLAQL